MKNYYRVIDIRFRSGQNLIDQMEVAPTSFDRSLFFPPIILSRLEIIRKIESGDDFFIDTKEVKRVSIQLFSVDGKAFLKTSNRPLQRDFIEVLPEITIT